MEKGKALNNDEGWNDNIKYIKLINDSINIEKTINDVKILGESIEKCDSNNNLEILFEDKRLDKIKEEIYQFGKIKLIQSNNN